MKILGIDPGSRITGYGIVIKEGNRLVHVDNGAIFTDPKGDFAQRLKKIYQELGKVIEEYQPDAMAVEQIFFANNVQTALKLGQARGVAIVAGVNAGLSVHEYTAMQVKQAVVGYGHATKDQVQRMVKALLNLPEVAQEDAADALAVAVCHAHSAGLAGAIRRAR
ncbi:MAG TPA: crossover junction endodeoxyribonuclease RuvC [Geobacteraceae bacterium]